MRRAGRPALRAPSFRVCLDAAARTTCLVAISAFADERSVDGAGELGRLRGGLVCFDDHVGSMLVLEPVEYAGRHKSTLGFLSVVDGFELQQDEHMVRVVNAAKYALHPCVLSGPWPILIEHRAPRVVVADLNPGDDERVHLRSLIESGDAYRVSRRAAGDFSRCSFRLAGAVLRATSALLLVPPS